MEPTRVLRSLPQMTIRETCHVFILLLLVTAGSVTAIIELILGACEIPENEKSALETVLGLTNSILQFAFTVEKMLVLHRIIVTIRHPNQDPVTTTDYEAARLPVTQNLPESSLPGRRLHLLLSECCQDLPPLLRPAASSQLSLGNTKTSELTPHFVIRH